jgi:glycine/sarcosine/betaine reductase complex component A
MDAESQSNIKRIAQSDGLSKDQIIVVLGASDIESAEISAETVTLGDPSYTGPLAGVPLGLPVYHILEPELRQFIPEAIYEEHVGIWTMAVDTEEIGRRFKAIREKVAKG